MSKTPEEIIADNLKKYKIQHFSKQGLDCVKSCMESHTSQQLAEREKEIERLKRESQNRHELVMLKVDDIIRLNSTIQSLKEEVEGCNQRASEQLIRWMQRNESQAEENKKLKEEKDLCINWLTDLMFTSDMDSTQHNKLDKFIQSLTPKQEESKIGNPIQPQNPLDNAYEESKGGGNVNLQEVTPQP